VDLNVLKPCLDRLAAYKEIPEVEGENAQ